MRKPRRIQRKRTKGWKMPKNCVYVGRPTKWGNPYRGQSRKHAVLLYRQWLNTWWYLDRQLEELRGKNLCCWCPLDQACHADVLLEIANDE